MYKCYTVANKTLPNYFQQMENNSQCHHQGDNLIPNDTISLISLKALKINEHNRDFQTILMGL